MYFLASNHDRGKVKEVSRFYLNVSFFLLFARPPLLFKVRSASLLCENVKQYPVLCDKKMKVYREKDVVSNAWKAGAKDLEFTKNGNEKILFYIVPWVVDDSGVEKNPEVLHYSHAKNNQKGWMASEASIEHSRTSTMKHLH